LILLSKKLLNYRSTAPNPCAVAQKGKTVVLTLWALVAVFRSNENTTHFIVAINYVGRKL